MHKDKKKQLGVVSRNRDLFSSYNIAHTRELIRYLSKDRFIMFHTIPFLLHVNSPVFPGYVDHPLCAYGIYGFEDSGFWKLGLKHFRFREKNIRPWLARKYHIKGLYLMGSSGTLAQTEFSDFDYWVIIDKKKLTQIQVDLLSQKLLKIEKWSLEENNLNVCFFILDLSDIQNNIFPSIDGESSGTTQRTILKEEFYRTFIMIAGQVPLWAVVPAGISPGEYKGYADLIADSDPSIKDQYADLGYLSKIDKCECRGALLWQLNKAIQDPVKSFIKASLVAGFYFDENSPSLPCDSIKKKFGLRGLDSHTIDPYAVIFSKILEFHSNDRKGLDLARKCIFLRLCGAPLTSLPRMDSPRGRLLKNYISEWSWKVEKTVHLGTFDLWPEKGRCALEQNIFNRIMSLYGKIVHDGYETNENEGISPLDLKMLKNKVQAHFIEKPDKIPFCSSFLKACSRAKILDLSCDFDQVDEKWIVGGKIETQKKNSSSGFYETANLFKAMGWLISNRLCPGKLGNIIFKKGERTFFKKNHRILSSLYEFMEGEGDSLTAYSHGPVWQRAVIAISGKMKEKELPLQSPGILAKNSWNEYYFFPIKLKGIENRLLECYKIAEESVKLFQKLPSPDFKYLIFHHGADENGNALATIGEFIADLGQFGQGFILPHDKEPGRGKAEIDKRPILDI